jgi:hypothetical protein
MIAMTPVLGHAKAVPATDQLCGMKKRRWRTGEEGIICATDGAYTHVTMLVLASWQYLEVYEAAYVGMYVADVKVG